MVPTRPVFWEQTLQIIEVLRGFAPFELESLLDAKPDRALDLLDGYLRFDRAGPGTSALASYNGAAYRNMRVTDFDAGDFAFAQQHLRMFSALYGLLRPFDGILPHRLGLMCDVRVSGADLYSFWGERIRKELFAPGELVVNLSSKEYARLVTPFLAPPDRMLTCDFLIDRPGGARATVATVRAARGQMARFIIKNRVTAPDDLCDFDWDGYRFIRGRSSAERYVFVRQRPFSAL